MNSYQITLQLGGGYQVTHAQIHLFHAFDDQVVELIDRHSYDGGVLTFEANLSNQEGIVYVLGTVTGFQGGQVQTDQQCTLLGVFLPSDTILTLSPQSTIAGVNAFAQFIDNGDSFTICGPSDQLRLALKMCRNFIGADGTVSPVISSAPNGLQTNSYALFQFLSNLWQYGLVEYGQVYQPLLGLTQDSSNLLAAVAYLAQHPFTEVAPIYALIAEQEQWYTPSLPTLTLPEGYTPVPDHWALAIKVNDSGALNFVISGCGYVVFDKNDRAWIANNVHAGTAYSATFSIVLEPDGSPALFSPVQGGGILGPGFGVAASSTQDIVAFGNYGWGPSQWNPQEGGVSYFNLEGKPLSPPNGFTNGLSRVQGLVFDPSGNLWMASWGTQVPMLPSPDTIYPFRSGNSAVVVYLNGDPERMVKYNFDSPLFRTFDVAIGPDGSAYVSNSGYNDQDNHVPSSVYKFQLNGDNLKLVAKWESGSGELPANTPANETFRQVSVNSKGEVFIACVATSRILHLSSNLEYIGEYKDEVHASWGVGFDGADNMYVANFQPRKVKGTDGSTKHQFGVAVYNANEVAEFQGFLSLPTGGEQVTLANGFPIYGNVHLSCYQPIMKQTGTNVDRAANLWVMNNWKPDIPVDAAYEGNDNPGGDGVVIFVGVAAPKSR